jgi:hypothetical protein
MTTSGTKAPAKVYRVRICPVSSNNDADSIRHLRALLKTLLRQHHFRALTVEEEQDLPVTSGRTG